MIKRTVLLATVLTVFMATTYCFAQNAPVANSGNNLAQQNQGKTIFHLKVK